MVNGRGELGAGQSAHLGQAHDGVKRFIAEALDTFALGLIQFEANPEEFRLAEESITTLVAAPQMTQQQGKILQPTISIHQ
jgi:hypothetical protein